jgi:hypothetical protein
VGDLRDREDEDEVVEELEVRRVLGLSREASRRKRLTRRHVTSGL